MSPIAEQTRIAHNGLDGILELNPGAQYDRGFYAKARHVSGISNPELDGDVYVLVKGDVAKVLVDTKDGRVYGANIFKKESGLRPSGFLIRYDKTEKFDPLANQEYMTNVPDLELKVQRVLDYNAKQIHSVLNRAMGRK